MKHQDLIRELFDEAPIPERLLPDNIALMLKEKAKTATKEIIKAENISSNPKSININKRSLLYRATATIAASIVLLIGVTTYFHKDSNSLPTVESDGSSIKTELHPASSYTELYNTFQKMYVSSNKRTIVDVISDILAPNAIANGNTTGIQEDATDTLYGESTIKTDTQKQYSETHEQVAGVEEADIIKTDGSNIYYIANNKLYIVSTDNGNMSLLSESSTNNIIPIEMFINGTRLVVISNDYSKMTKEPMPQDDIAIPYEGSSSASSGSTSSSSGIDSQSSGSATPTVGAGTSSSSATQSSVAPVATSNASSGTLPAGDDTNLGRPDAPTSNGVASNSTVNNGEVQDIFIDQGIGYWYKNNLVVEIYDISDSTAPTVINTYKQDGNYISSRMIDNVMYIMTSYSDYQIGPITDENDLESYVPSYHLNDQKCYISASDIQIPEYVESTSYTILAGIDINATEPLVSIKAMLGYNGTIYSSNDYIYIIGNKWNKNSETTTIARFSLDNGTLTQSAFGTVPGVVLNQFSMDEYNGFFRIATTDLDYSNFTQSNGLYVLDSNLEIVGSISGLAETETIQSVRYDKNIAYVVTFRQTDPLYTIDLTDPTNPSVMSELKVSGYSSYLYKYADGLLLGFGIEADENGSQTGLKLSMFNTDELNNVNEISKIVLGDELQYATSSALSNHKSLLIDGGKNIIGVPVSYYDKIDTCNQYILFSYNATDGFVKIGAIETHDVYYNNEFSRGMYIGDVVYAFSQGRIISASISDMSIISTLVLTDGNTNSYGPETRD